MDNNETVTIQDVALRAGVSAMTVSRVLNGSRKVAPDTRQRIEQAIKELGYVPNALAQGLSRGRTQTIGLIMGDITNPYWTEVASGAEEVTHQNGYTLVIGNVGEQAAKLGEMLQTMLSNRIAGLLVNAYAPKLINPLVERGYPLVIIGPEDGSARTDVVKGDVLYGAQVLTRHLLNLGYQRIGLVNGPKKDPESIDREKGYRQVLVESGLRVNDAWIVYGSYSRHGGYEPAQALLSLPAEQRPTALIACNNFLALGIIETARHLGLRIPEDVALVCFDDLEPASAIDPFLTVMAQPARVLGIQSTQLLITRLNNPDRWQPSRIVFKPELIVRRSCGSLLNRR